MNFHDIVTPVRRRVREEEGAVNKTAPFRVALCYPAPYPVAMSSLGFQTIYREINLHPAAAAERAFLPDCPDVYRKSRTPVFTYETETPVSSFPVVAFSIAYEPELPGLIEMLHLGGIPPLRNDRTGKHPLVVAGGPLTLSNPLVLAPFVDMIVVGEGEELIHRILDAAAGTGKGDLPACFSEVPGCLVPGLTRGVPKPARAADDRLPAFSRIITPQAVLSSMFLIEPERGCSRDCAYCVMRRTSGGMRVVPAEKVLSLLPENARRVGLVGAAVTDHPEIKRLVHDVVAGGREIGVSSLRADRLDEELVRLLARGGCRTLTTAADGASQRLRDSVDRSTTEEHLIRAAGLVRVAGMQRLKLYAMIGLPGETMEDIDELIGFSRELARIAPLSLSIAPFVAKRNTPLDGSPFEAIPSQTRKIARIRAGLKAKADVKPASPRWAWVEYMLSQGGESAGLAAYDAWKSGGSFAAWKRAFSDRGE
ncbi:MAG TPA: radical SAM protein [Acidobacteriota bacterium]|nr:radical SAM protein [Acidobacteriota bacterium]